MAYSLCNFVMHVLCNTISAQRIYFSTPAIPVFYYLLEFTHADFFTGKTVSKGTGRLVIVGSGIRSAGQFTTEAISHIKNADKVLFFASDPVTETYIRDLFPGALDLGVFFDSSKDRYDSCVQMAEACLFFARQGLYTVAIFPGHPGISSLPSLRAMQIAKKQGMYVCRLFGQRILHAAT